MPTEIWKDIEDYEGRYQISDLGRVKSLARKVCGPLACRILEEKIMSLQIWQGYQCIWFRTAGQKKKKFKVHRLVAMAFMPIPDMEFLEFNHKNKDKNNNTLENLEWCNHEENIYHRDHYQCDNQPF